MRAWTAWCFVLLAKEGGTATGQNIWSDKSCTLHIFADSIIDIFGHAVPAPCLCAASAMLMLRNKVAKCWLHSRYLECLMSTVSHTTLSPQECILVLYRLATSDAEAA